MKKYLILLGIIISFSCCSSDDDITTTDDVTTIPEEVISCETQNLDIDERSKFSELYYGPENTIDEYNSKRWHWRVENDTIKVGGNIGPFGGGQYFFFKKNQNNCIDLLLVRNVYYDDVLSFDVNTQELISGGYTWSDLCDLNLTVQEYIEDERIVVKVSNEEIGFNKTLWIDFTLDVFRPVPFDYETSGFIDPNGPHGGC